METNSVFIKDNAASGKELQNLQKVPETTSNSKSFGQVEAVFTRCSRNIRNLDRP